MSLKEPAITAEYDFVDRIIEGFRTIQARAAYEVLAAQFEAGELSFIVDRQGIRMHLDEIDLDDPEVGPIEDLDS